MAGGLEDRRKALEEKWAHDEDLRFKVHVRWAKLVGLWAAGEMGIAGKEAEDYAKACVEIDIAKDGDEKLFAKIRADFDAHGIARSDHFIRSKMAELLDVAKDQVIHEG